MRNLRFGTGVEVPVASLPQTYEIVRQGVTESVAVADHDELVALRTE